MERVVPDVDSFSALARLPAKVRPAERMQRFPRLQRERSQPRQLRPIYPHRAYPVHLQD